MGKQLDLKWPGSVPTTEYDVAFLQGMLDRMAISWHKYGDVSASKGEVDTIACLLLRLAKHSGTTQLRVMVEALPVIEPSHNTEFLMDAANFAMMHFMHEGPGACHPTDSNQSPGRVWLANEYDNDLLGEISARANDGTPQ